MTDGYQVDMKYYKNDNKESELVVRITMDYNLWKETYREYIERYISDNQLIVLNLTEEDLEEQLNAIEDGMFDASEAFRNIMLTQEKNKVNDGKRTD